MDAKETKEKLPTKNHQMIETYKLEERKLNKIIHSKKNKRMK